VKVNEPSVAGTKETELALDQGVVGIALR
jgi:hypothetical protein